MNKYFLSGCLAIFITLLAPQSNAATAILNDWCVNVNSFNVVNNACNGGGPVASNVNLSAFDLTLAPSTNNLGTAKISLTGSNSPQYVSIYLDYDLDINVLGSFNDFGNVIGAAPAGVSYELADPNTSSLFNDFASGALTSTNSVGFAGNPIGQCCDVAWALGVGNINVPVGGTGLVTFTSSFTAPTSGFYLKQTNASTGSSIYLSESVVITPGSGGGSNTPEPGRWYFIGTGALLALALRFRGQFAAFGRKNKQAAAGAAAIVVAALVGGGTAQAVQPVVLTVPAVATAPLTPHDAWSGAAVTLKGTTNVQGAGFTYKWVPGDGGANCTGTVANQYIVECAHTYNAAVGSVFTATLTVTDTSTSQSAITNYYVKINNPPPNLTIEVNRAIDEGLWYLHKAMTRTTVAGVNYGDWQSCQAYTNAQACFGNFTGLSAANTNAFEVSGHLANGSPTDPYTEDVSRAVNSLFTFMQTSAITNSITNPSGTYNPDGNGNGLGVTVNSGDDIYQLGMFMDAIVATGTPNAVAATGPTGIASRTYKSLVQDMVDYYAYCENSADSFGTPTGGWRYSCQYGSTDNSVNQWAAIGIIPARSKFQATLPDPVLGYNQAFLKYSQNAAGYYGYSDSNAIWGPYADTPSGLVQLAMNGIGRGNPLWDKTETYLRDNFDNPTGDPTTSLKSYYYGMFSFTKSMLLHNPNGPSGAGVPITLLTSKDNVSKTPIDWYGAQAPPRGNDSSDGVARTLVGTQGVDGSWFAHNYTGDQFYFETAWSIVMLNRTVFQQLPVACAKATPNPVASGGKVLLDGSCSFDQDPNSKIVTWQWDPTGGTNFTLTGVKVTFPFTAKPNVPLPQNFPVRLRVTNNSNPALSSDFILVVQVNSPPTPPTANAGGPYNFCPNLNVKGQPIYVPWFLDGSKSSNPDNGKTDGTPGAPPSAIVSYDWDFNCANTFNSASGAQVRVDTGANNFFNRVGQSFNVCLRVTNNDNLAFPTAGLAAGLSSVASAPVFVRNATDETCTHCVGNLQALAKAATPGVPGNVQLYWTDTNTAQFPIDHYNVYRSTSPTFAPFTLIAGAGAAVPAVQVPGTFGATVFFVDKTVSNKTTYYYRVAPATLADTETCASNLTIQVAVGGR